MTLSTNLVSYWKLDESSGNAADSIGSNTGANTGVTYTTGKINNGAVFDSATDLLDCGTNSSLNLTSSYTIAGWLKPSSLPTSGNQAVWVARESGGGYYASLYNNGGTQYLRLVNQNGANNSITDIAYSLSTSVFTHVAWVYDDTADTMTLYINGASQGTGTSKIYSPGSVTTNFYIGTYLSSVLPYSGMIDELGIWSRALSSTEVSYLYNSGTGISVPFDLTLTFNSGSYTYTGNNFGLYRNFYIAITSGAYSYVGNTINLIISRILTFAKGTFTYTGFNILLSKGINIVFGSGNYTYTGNNITIAKLGRWRNITKNDGSPTNQTKNTAVISNQPDIGSSYPYNRPFMGYNDVVDQLSSHKLYYNSSGLLSENIFTNQTKN